MISRLSDFELFIFDWDNTLLDCQQPGVVLCQGAQRLLSYLFDQGKQLAIATGRGRQSLNEMLIITEVAEYFVYSRTASECWPKPHPQMIEQILEWTGVAASAAVMVADSLTDGYLAKNAGLACVLINQENWQSQLAQLRSLTVVNNLDQLYDWMTNNG